MQSKNDSILVSMIQSVLTNDLRIAPWKGSLKPMEGHCYVACEALFALLGGKASGWTPCFIRHEGQPHWFLRHKSGRVLDPTVSQFITCPNYSNGRGKGFLTKEPSKRAKEVLRRYALAKEECQNAIGR